MDSELAPEEIVHQKYCDNEDHASCEESYRDNHKLLFLLINLGSIEDCYVLCLKLLIHPLLRFAAVEDIDV